MESGGESLDLLASLLERAGAVDFLCSVTQLFLHRHLRGDAATSFVFTESARGQAFDLLLRAAPGDYEPVELSVHPGLDKQSRFNDCCVTRAFALPFLEPAGDSLGDPRVDDGIETIEPRAIDRKSTRLNSSHMSISYAVFCL